MKKLFITIAFVAATMFASAQLYVGGSLGLGTQSGKDEFKADNVTVTVDQPNSSTSHSILKLASCSTTTWALVSTFSLV